MGLNRWILTVLCVGYWTHPTLAIVGAIEGEIPEDHPASYNTVALVKKLKNGDHNYKIFCSGFIVSPQIVMTAKHCLGDVDLKDVWIYFGPNTNQVEPQLLRKPLETSVYGPQDWQNYFPSFDSAWIRISDLPNADGQNPNWPRFRPVPLLLTPEPLAAAEVIHLAGYGNQSAEFMKIIAGEKKHVATRFKKYMNTRQVASLVLLEGDRGHNNCHGDSGGPAYALITDPVSGQKKWTVFGSAAGFDLALTPQSYEKLNDDLFPYVAYCDRAQTLYTFVGDYAAWVSSSAQSLLDTVGTPQTTQPGLEGVPSTLTPATSFAEWCETTTFADSAWLTVRKLLIDAMENAVTTWSQDEIFLDCKKAEQALATLTRIDFKPFQAWGRLDPLTTLIHLKDLRFVKTKAPDLSVFKNSRLEKLVLENLGLKDLAQVGGLEAFQQLVHLSVVNNQLTDISPLSSLLKLRSLNISWNQIENIEALRQHTELELLDFSSNRVQDLSPILGHSSLITLVGSNNRLVSPASATAHWPRLEKVYLINNQLTDLEFLKGSFQITHLKTSGNPLK